MQHSKRTHYAKLNNPYEGILNFYSRLLTVAILDYIRPNCFMLSSIDVDRKETIKKDAETFIYSDNFTYICEDILNFDAEALRIMIEDEKILRQLQKENLTFF